MIYKIFDIDITFLPKCDLLNEIVFNNEVKTIACANQDFLNISFNDNRFKKNLNRFDIVHPDGVGILFAKNILYGKKEISGRITCPDLLDGVLDICNKHKMRIFILGGKSLTLNKARKKIEQEFDKIKITGTHNGYFDINDSELVEKINRLQVDLLIVGMGATIQEEWINNWINKINVSKIYAVGGALRVLANERKRGPRIIQKIGFEWFIRLLTEPHHVWKRYIIGIPLFIFRVLEYKIKLGRKIS